MKNDNIYQARESGRWAILEEYMNEVTGDSARGRSER